MKKWIKPRGKSAVLVDDEEVKEMIVKKVKKKVKEEVKDGN